MEYQNSGPSGTLNKLIRQHFVLVALYLRGLESNFVKSQQRPLEMVEVQQIAFYLIQRAFR